MADLTPSRKGAIAEAAIVHECVKLGLEVLRPFGEGRRYDLVIDTGDRLLRAQVKWARYRAGVITIEARTCRHTPGGYVRTTYGADEIDGFAVYCDYTRECFWLPIVDFEGQGHISLRLSPARNNQSGSIRWAAHYPFRGCSSAG